MLFLYPEALLREISLYGFESRAFAILKKCWFPTLFLAFFVPFSIHAQQCTLPSRIFLPEADVAKYEQLGTSVDLDGEYMVAGISENSSQQVYNGKVLVYKLDAQAKWILIAELTPSDAGKYRNFGSQVAISGNTIVVRATEYNDAGVSRGKIYVFEKSDAEEWTSTTEDYVLKKDFGDYLHYNGYGRVKMNSTELICFASEGGDSRLEVFKKSGGVFSLSQTIELPRARWGGDYDWNFAVTDDLIAISTEQYQHPDNSNGAAFIFEKVAGSYKTSPVMLISANQSPTQWEGFGLNIAAHNNTIFIQGLRSVNGYEYNQIFFVFEKPATGWIDSQSPAMLEHPGYVFYYSQLIANDNYLLATGPNYESVIGFKKSGSEWTSAASPFQIDGFEIDKSLTGYQIAMNEDHLVVGCPNRYGLYNSADENITDFYSPTGEWDNPDLTYNQILRYTSLNATDDFFGESFGVYNDQIAICASGDDANGINSGAVYVFETKNSNAPLQKIFPPEAENYTGFGRSIAMGDSVMFISAPFKDSLDVDGKAVFYSIGKVYVYRLHADGWKYASQIIAPNIHSEVTFGQNVVWSSGYCAVTEFYGGSSESVGRVHIYKENLTNGKFEYLATLDPKEHLRSDFFGNSMVMTDSMMVIGTGGSAPNSSYRQSAYVFIKKGEWTSTYEDARLMCSDTGWFDRFGASVSLYGDYVVVGAPNWPGYDPRPIPRDYIIPGAAYIYKKPRGGWKGLLTEIAKLSPSDPTDFGNFGASVVIDRNDIFVGSPNVYAQYNYSDKLTNNDHTLIPGKVYHFTKPQGEWQTTKQEKRQLQSFEPEIVDGYGASIYISSRYLYVGAMLDDTEKGFRTGSVQTMMQLPAVDGPPVLCLDQAPVKLQGFPKGGGWSGPGVNVLGMFSPSAAGPGTHTISYHHSGCEGTIIIQVLPREMTILYQSPSVQEKCVGQTIPVVFQSSEGAENYTWYYRETLDQPLVKIDSMKQAIAASKGGYYEARVSRGECPERTEQFRILEEEVVVIHIEPQPLICDVHPVAVEATPPSGQWYGPGISSDGFFDPNTLNNGTYKLLYQVVTNAGCHWKDSLNVTVDILKQPELQYDGRTICGDNPVQLKVINTDYTTKVYWYRDGILLNQNMVGNIATTTPGNYKVIAAKGACQLETETRNVPREDVNIEFQVSAVCSDSKVMLNATPAGGTWDGAVITPAGEFDPAGIPNGVYPQAYTLLTPSGCTWQRVLNLPVDKLEQPSLKSDITEICIDRPATLVVENVDNRSTVTWYDAADNTIPGLQGQTVLIRKPGSYYAAVSKSTCTLRTPFIELVTEPDSLFVPNVFTANDDSFNDYFEIRVEGIDEMQLKVFNRYGRSIFQTTDPLFHWTAPDVPAGVYFWHMTYRTCADTRREEKGWVNVVK